MEQRKELLSDRHDLPSRYWEPEPDEEDLEQMEQKNTELWADDVPLPFEGGRTESWQAGQEQRAFAISKDGQPRN